MWLYSFFFDGFVHVLLLASGALFLSLFIPNKNTITQKNKMVARNNHIISFVGAQA